MINENQTTRRQSRILIFCTAGIPRKVLPYRSLSRKIRALLPARFVVKLPPESYQSASHSDSSLHRLSRFRLLPTKRNIFFTTVVLPFIAGKGSFDVLGFCIRVRISLKETNRAIDSGKVLSYLCAHCHSADGRIVGARARVLTIAALWLPAYHCYGVSNATARIRLWALHTCSRE